MNERNKDTGCTDEEEEGKKKDERWRNEEGKRGKEEKDERDEGTAATQEMRKERGKRKTCEREEKKVTTRKRGGK